ncbi:methyltransferase domain-containing protein [Zeaxanthinibacter enoshimensis]|uniref:Thiopurine S-methyltransferase n=1 Tax=Zeaxanthinibacter enoshimensis TaxID=392009 RepID=A0A4R6TJ93_9FLAO|nr:methyltransferase domain-containing protein [Zeaxanthinibacter enoshimensis]TDQ30924.1 thiopurine S-methyltransferase [Zeaxanthinibacter enoshimensis]
MKLNKKYWEQRYAENRLGWDIGHVSTPLKTYIDGLQNKELKILIPGAGHGYEVSYLHQQGFTSVYAVDYAAAPLQRILKENPDFPEDQLIEGDFFELEESGFDLILEQTFFCSLPPDLRSKYVQKTFDLLKTGGTLSGVFFDFPLTEQGPPFGGDLELYRELFQPPFRIRILERAYNSIPPRQGNELFFIFTK